MIGEEIQKSVFRDTKTYYEGVHWETAARQLLRFAKKHAGKEVLDLGCATGNYSLKLLALGYTVKGADVNPRYVQIARERGVDAQLIEDRLPFPDHSFDTVLAFEVLEHVADPDTVIREAKRVGRKNVLFTTPNCEGVSDLQQSGLLFEHFADLDHRNFFTEESFRRLLSPYFARVVVKKGDGINSLALLPWPPIRFAGRILTRLRFLPAGFHSRLFALAEL